MKKISIFLFVASFIMLGLTLAEKKSASLIPEKKMVQVGIIVKDIEKSTQAWTQFLGLEKAPRISTTKGSETNPTKYRGQASNAKAKLAFFQFDNITIELIEPLGGSSTWQEFLDDKGEGIHHIAFMIDEMDASIKSFEEHGISLIQHGGWDTGEYSYMDGTNDLGLIIELLEHYKK